LGHGTCVKTANNGIFVSNQQPVIGTEVVSSNVA
jgi:hypothetical protein